jgi:hypothetical protein
VTTPYEDLVAPDAYVLDITPGTPAFDLSTVSAALLRVRAPDGTTATWSATMSNQTATTLTLTHVMSATDVENPGVYHIYASLTVAGGTKRTATIAQTFKGEFEV